MSNKTLTAKQTTGYSPKRETARPVAHEPVAQTQQADPGTLHRATADLQSASSVGILALERRVGNRAVSRLLAKTSAAQSRLAFRPSLLSARRAISTSRKRIG